ncbi:phytanoyl-CoA dioxygenase family protein [Arenibacter sp. M-2]|uniref:phytanoyl-CoA dioxygenase family protein n=1 Tax=Arenibacter sp. M-2 TaxID=3053612 RepID=UPI00257022FC|nr:phytanoyl-CoA dioxygenase family protein [Arenibacter sp. M-2]MDL5510505.1 phytanoyl-CoA dioxygenase family protein [Arenibacter sp. M-2]
MKPTEILNDKTFCFQLRQDFLRDGYILFPKFLKLDEIELVNKKIQEFIRTKVSAMPATEVYYEDIDHKDTLKQLQKLFDYDPFFFDMVFGSRFEKLASVLLDDNVVGKNMQYFNKPSRIGKPTPPHQDGYYFMLTPNEAVTMWMPLEPVDEENGCIRYVKSSHMYGIRSHGRTGTLGFSQGIMDFGCPNDIANEVFFPTQPGDLLVHHSLTIHRADGNPSERTRKALGFIYYAEKAKEDKAAHETYAQHLAKELAEDKKI